MKLPLPVLLAGGGLHGFHGWTDHHNGIAIPASAPASAGVPLKNFVSFSIEFSYFPDFAGNSTHPNTFSNNLLDNIAALSGSKPDIRVGGSTQDKALFVESQEEGIILIFAEPGDDQPANLTFGPKFFDSYHTWPDTSFVHGYNLKYNSTSDHEALLASVPYACAALRNQYVGWEIGNEADLYAAVFPGVPDSERPWPLARPTSYSEDEYVTEWLNLTRAIDASVREHCPGVAADEQSWYGPSFADAPGLSTLDPVEAWEAGLDTDENLKVFAAHQ